VEAIDGIAGYFTHGAQFFLALEEDVECIAGLGAVTDFHPVAVALAGPCFPALLDINGLGGDEAVEDGVCSVCDGEACAEGHFRELGLVQAGAGAEVEALDGDDGCGASWDGGDVLGVEGIEEGEGECECDDEWFHGMNLWREWVWSKYSNWGSFFRRIDSDLQVLETKECVDGGRRFLGVVAISMSFILRLICYPF
jgi:hypothetical protein